MWFLLILWIWHSQVIPSSQGSIDGVQKEKEHMPVFANRIHEAIYRNYDNTKYWTANTGPKRAPDLTPDYKEDEIPPLPKFRFYYKEFERPYKLHPFTMSAAYWDTEPGNYDHPQLLGCYCCTVFKRSVPLAGCAVLTTRHILTTATATELVLKEYPESPNLENILGAYYDISYYTSNTSAYMTPARIHYHPRYVMPENVNVSHPIPSSFDLAVWASTKPFHYYISDWNNRETYICNRAGSYWLQFGSPTLGAVKQPVAIVVGFQFMLWYKYKPMPSFKYAVKTQKYTAKCPKTEWGWFFCLWGRWAMLGLDSGAALHRATQGHSWLYDGLLGLHAFSMDLRAKELTFYFTPVENHAVLTFLYDAYMGTIPYRYLDKRFFDARWQAPYPRPGESIYLNYEYEVPEDWVKTYDPPSFY